MAGGQPASDARSTLDSPDENIGLSEGQSGDGMLDATAALGPGSSDGRNPDGRRARVWPSDQPA